MVGKKSTRLARLAIQLTTFTFSIVGLLFKLFNQLGEETRLASQGLVKIMALMVLLTILLASTWFCGLALLYLYLSSLHYSAYLTLFILFLINCLGIVLVIAAINHIRRSCFYPEIRKNLEEVKSIWQ